MAAVATRSDAGRRGTRLTLSEGRHSLLMIGVIVKLIFPVA